MLSSHCIYCVLPLFLHKEYLSLLPPGIKNFLFTEPAYYNMYFMYRTYVRLSVRSMYDSYLLYSTRVIPFCHDFLTRWSSKRPLASDSITRATQPLRRPPLPAELSVSTSTRMVDSVNSTSMNFGKLVYILGSRVVLSTAHFALFWFCATGTSFRVVNSFFLRLFSSAAAHMNSNVDSGLQEEEQ